MKRNDLGKTEILKQNPLGEKTTMPWRNRVSVGPAIMTVRCKRAGNRGKRGWKCVKRG